MFKQIQKYFFSLNYQQEAQAIISTHYRALKENPQKEQLKIISQFFNSIWKARMGILNNNATFNTFLSSSVDTLNREMSEFHNSNNQIEKANLIYNIIKNAQDIQLQRWEGITIFNNWITKQETFNLFISIKQPVLYLSLFNLTQDNRAHPKVEYLMNNFKRQPPQSFEDCLQYYKAITYVRQPYSDELKHIKYKILELSRIESSVMAQSKAFQETLANYIELLCNLFFEDNEFMESDEEFEDGDDIEMIEPLQKLIRLFQQQDILWYNSEVQSHLENPDMKPNLIDLVDPIKWNQIKSVVKGIHILAQYDEYNKNQIDMLEDVVFRKLESDPVIVEEGVEILLYLYDLSDQRKGRCHMLTKSICDQILNQDLETLTIKKVSKLFEALMRVSQLGSDYELSYINPAFNKIVQWLKDGQFNNLMRIVDWYDLQNLFQKYHYKDLDQFIIDKINY